MKDLNQRKGDIYKIILEVAQEYEMAGLADGVYADFATEVAMRYADQELYIKNQEVSADMELSDIQLEILRKGCPHCKGKILFTEEEDNENYLFCNNCGATIDSDGGLTINL